MNFNSIKQFNYGDWVIAIPMALFSCAALAIDTPNNAQGAVMTTDPGSTSYLAQLVVGLMVVFFCIAVLAWLVKRFNGFQSSSGGVLQILGGLSMGTRERVVLVQVGSTQLLLGVAPGRINTLHVLEQPIEATGASSEAPSGMNFSEKFSSILSRDKP